MRPKTAGNIPIHIDLYRAQLSCEIARNGIDNGKGVPDNTSRIEWAIYNLAYAIEGISKHLEKEAKSE